MGLILGIITGASLLACSLVAVWMVGAIYYDVCDGARWGRWGALAWAVGVIAMFAAWRPLWQPIVALLGAESLFLAWWYQLKPSNDRDWDPSMAVLPRAVIAGDAVTIENVRNLEYRSIDDFTPECRQLCQGAGNLGANLHRYRIDQDILRQPPDFGRHGGREEECLALFRQMAENPPDIREKAHVEHLVCLVQHQHLQVGEVDDSLADKVEKATRTGNNDLGAAPQLFHLRVDPNAAVDRDAPESGLLAQGGEGLVDLFGQFPGGGDDQRPDPPPLLLDEPVENGKGKGRGLAGAGLGQSHDVTPGHDRRDRFFLDGCRCDIPGCGYACGNLVMKRKCLKTHETPFLSAPFKEKAPEAVRGLR